MRRLALQAGPMRQPREQQERVQEPHEADQEGGLGRSCGAGVCRGDLSAPQAEGGGHPNPVACSVDEELGTVSLDRASKAASRRTRTVRRLAWNASFVLV